MEFINNDWFIVSNGFAPLYSRPSFNSNCLTEMAYGDSCKILDCKDSWLFVKLNDGYKGWIKKFYGFESKFKKEPRYIIVFPNEKGFFHPKYPFGAKLMKKRSGSVAVNHNISFNSITKILNNLLGIPYKWGGKTTLGFDCSVLVQAVLGVYGINLPRDSMDQWVFLKESKVSLNETKKGDLHFFGKNNKVNHVAISCGGLNFIHSQGFVKKESLDQNNQNFNKSLLDIYLASASIRLKFQI